MSDTSVQIETNKAVPPANLTVPISSSAAAAANANANAVPSGGGFYHISNVNTWKHPDRNFWIYVALSIFTGFIGLDHLYLRSNETAIKKIIVNFSTFGFWYFYDIIQLLVESKKVRKEGLSSPLDWIQGIGKGMFIPKKTKEEEKKGPNFSAPKSYVLYVILAVAFGIFGADKFYIGNTFQGLAKFMSVFSIIFTIFGIVWVLYDAVMAIFFTKSILEKGISVPPPFSFIFRTPIPGKPLFEVQEEKKEEKKPFSIMDYIPLSGIIKSAKEMAPKVMQEVIQPLVGPSACAVMKHAGAAQQIGTSAIGLATSALATAPSLIGEVTSQLSNMTNPQALQRMIAEPAEPAGLFTVTPERVQQIAQAAYANRQSGGGYQSSGAGPILAGTLTALVIAGGLKGTYEFLSNR